MSKFYDFNYVEQYLWFGTNMFVNIIEIVLSSVPFFSQNLTNKWHRINFEFSWKINTVKILN